MREGSGLLLPIPEAVMHANVLLVVNVGCDCNTVKTECHLQIACWDANLPPSGPVVKKAKMAKRCLTVPSEGRGNDGYDNEHNDLILNVDDVLSSSSRRCARSIRLSGPLKKLVYTLHQCYGGARRLRPSHAQYQ